MNNKRPVNLNLFTIKFPPTAITSILHRISGFLLFLFIPFLLYVLGFSLASPAKFHDVTIVMSNPFVKFIIWVFLACLLYHLVAGIRHLLMDMGIGETKTGGRIGAISVMVVSALLIILIGIWLW